ncbi:MAG: response regulator [Halioglobus sp.]|nr:response regulator [Halioglobus sp.]
MSLRIVVADDEALIRQDLSELLTGLGHRVVASARDGAEALEQIELHNPDLVILDIKMPRMDGLEVAQHIGGRHPIIMLTAHSSPDFIHSARDAGVMAYITKPFREADIAPTIEMAITHFLRGAQLDERVSELREQLEARRLTDRAKALLVEKRGIAEKDAHRELQRLSMKYNLSLKALAQKLIDALT